MSKKYRHSPYKETIEVIRKNNWWGPKYIRSDLITPGLALRSVKECGSSLEFIPAHLQTQEIIEIALKQDPGNSKYIKIKEMFKNALEEVLDE